MKLQNYARSLAPQHSGNQWSYLTRPEVSIIERRAYLQMKLLANFALGLNVIDEY